MYVPLFFFLFFFISFIYPEYDIGARQFSLSIQRYIEIYWAKILLFIEYNNVRDLNKNSRYYDTLL